MSNFNPTGWSRVAGTAGSRRRLREALHELSDNVSNLINILDAFDAMENEALGFKFETDNSEGSKLTADVAEK